MNQLTIIGFTGNDAEVHYTSAGVLITTLSVATKESWKNADGQWQSRTEWHRVVSFGRLAEYAPTVVLGNAIGPRRRNDRSDGQLSWRHVASRGSVMAWGDVD